MRPSGVVAASSACGMLAVIALLGTEPARAHEVRPAYVELEEISAGRFDMLWKQPLAAGLPPLPLRPLLAPACDTALEPLTETYNDALVERSTLDCGAQGLEGRRLSIEGLERTLTDALVRVRFADGEEIANILRPEHAEMLLSRANGPAIAAYLRLGIEHLLFGFDHILFVIGLLFFVRRAVDLFKVVSAFTIAHSITLSLSALGVVRLAPAPVEAVIALTILFLAVELFEPKERRPQWLEGRAWVVAFGFGLLHGFGFAGALAQIGLPRHAIAPALFLFNVGVEIGQLMVVACVLSLVAVVRWRRVAVPRLALRAPIWAMGTLSATWFVERVARIVG